MGENYYDINEVEVHKKYHLYSSYYFFLIKYHMTYFFELPIQGSMKHFKSLKAQWDFNLILRYLT